METINAILSQLTFADLDQWAGEKIRARGQSYVKRVDGLQCTHEDDLVAWVAGTEDYATLVRLDPAGQHSWFCTCPYEAGPCKHAVAVILAAAEEVKQQRQIPVLAEDDDLHLMLFGEPDDEVDWEDGEEVDAVDNAEADPVSVPGKAKKTGVSKVRKLLGDKSREELLDLLVALAKEYPEIERRVQEAEQLRSGQIEPLVRSLRKEIKKLTAEPAWYSHWNNEGSVPDYSHVQRQLEALLDKGHADRLLELGDELWRLGTDQVEQSDDEGQTMGALSECMEIVLQAVAQSSWPRSQQLLWVIDHLLEDEFSLLESGDAVLDNAVYTPADWREAAVALEHRLSVAAKPRGANFSDAYRRTRLVNRLIDAYKKGGEPEKILPLLESEADACQNYEQLVVRLLEGGNKEAARQWCVQGFGRTLKESPGIAASLQKRLREMAAADKRDDLVAAYRAQDYFRHASLENFRELRKAA
ncbi:MAG: SWIM zinc finger family protein, partial [Desulfobulbus sp.]|nr:SWIM zinc finger family protein [Desulfobulbus sp.]